MGEIINLNYMDYTICDCCQETIKGHNDKTYISLAGESGHYSLCKECSKPIKAVILERIVEPDLQKQRQKQ